MTVKERLRAVAVLAALAAAAGSPARATPLRCDDPCTIEALGVGYLPPEQEIAGGSEVVWVTTDKSYPTSNAFDPDEQCFIAEVGKGVPPTPVRFDLDGGSVFATSAAGTSRCPTASALPSGGFALPFQCILHPWMHGALLIQP